MFISSLLIPLVALGARVLAVPAISNAAHDSDLSATYDLTRSGAGGHSIEPPNLFNHLDARGTPQHSRDLAGVGPPQDLHKLTFTPSCGSDRRPDVINAIVVSKQYITAAIEYLENQNDKAIYVRWFGTYDHHRADRVVQVLTWLRNQRISEARVGCQCTDDSEPFQFSAQANIVDLCRPFWQADRRGPWPSKALVLVRSGMSRLGHPIAGAASVEDCERLARNFPQRAINNPPSVMEFIRTVSGLRGGVGSPYS